MTRIVPNRMTNHHTPKPVALPPGQSLLCIHSCVSAPEGRWINRPALTLSAHFLTPFLSLPGEATARIKNGHTVSDMEIGKHEGLEFKKHLRSDISIQPTCSCCDFCCDVGVWTLNLSETWLSSSCPGCVIVTAVYPYSCCDAA